MLVDVSNELVLGDVSNELVLGDVSNKLVLGDVSNELVLGVGDVSHEFIKEKVPTKISTVIENCIAFVRNIAPDIVDNMVIGESPIIPIAVELIEWVESNVLSGKLSGQEKKRIVVNVLLWFIDHQKEVIGTQIGKDPEILRDIVQNVIPSVIDTIIAATKGKILVNKFAKTAKSCFSLCFA